MQSGQSAGSGESMAAKRARFEQLAMPAVNALYRRTPCTKMGMIVIPPT